MEGRTDERDAKPIIVPQNPRRGTTKLTSVVGKPFIIKALTVLPARG